MHPRYLTYMPPFCTWKKKYNAVAGKWQTQNLKSCWSISKDCSFGSTKLNGWIDGLICVWGGEWACISVQKKSWGYTSWKSITQKKPREDQLRQEKNWAIALQGWTENIALFSLIRKASRQRKYWWRSIKRWRVWPDRKWLHLPNLSISKEDESPLWSLREAG